MAASITHARMALRLLQISQKSRLLIKHPKQCTGGVLTHFKRYFADESSSKDDEVVPKPGIELSHPKPKLRAEAQAVDSSTSSSSDSSSESDGSSSSDSDSELSPELVSAVDDVAKTLGGDANVTTSELISALRSHDALTQERKESQVSSPELSEMFKGMRVQRQMRRRGDGPQPPNQGRTFLRKRPRQEQPDNQPGEFRERGVFAELADKLRDLQSAKAAGSSSTPPQPRPRQQQQQRPRQEIQLKLYDGQGLGIFKKENLATSVNVASVESYFDQLSRENLERQTTLPPENAFEEQIRWTREGKLWNFPIDNEQGLDEEAKVGFHEHVFLEPLIADFPRRGPLRHFMELVCVGLSKNPYFTVEEKKAHIDWFKNYFEEKKSLLDEALQNPDFVKDSTQASQPST